MIVRALTTAAILMLSAASGCTKTPSPPNPSRQVPLPHPSPRASGPARSAWRPWRLKSWPTCLRGIARPSWG
jgi:hypothetical protein